MFDFVKFIFKNCAVKMKTLLNRQTEARRIDRKNKSFKSEKTFCMVYVTRDIKEIKLQNAVHLLLFPGFQSLQIYYF